MTIQVLPGHNKAVGLCILPLLALVFTAALPADEPRGPIDDFIASEMSASGVPGLAYAIVADGEIKALEARGVVKLGSDVPVTQDTPFIIGSISKSFTALAVMQLVEAGKVDLDTEIARYLPPFSGEPAGSVTIRQLLSHTSGLSTFQGNRSHKDNTQSQDTLARLVSEQAEAPPASQPGTRWEYSNLNYQILGRLIEVLSGQTYQSYIQSNIMEPLDMTRSFVADGKFHDDMATGHRSWFYTKRPMAQNWTDLGTAPQGGIISSASDLARYLTMMMNGQDDIITAKSKTAMMSPASEASPFYGFGWFLDTEKGIVSHEGNSPGYESLATMVPAEKKAAVVLVNASGGMGFGETAQLRRGIGARALGLDYDGEGSRLSIQAFFIALALTPFTFLLSMIWTWTHRRELRAKSGAFGLFSLWFPLLTTLVSAWIVFSLMPSLVGASIATLNLFQPDLGLILIAMPATGVLWAMFRLGVYYSGKSGST